VPFADSLNGLTVNGLSLNGRSTNGRSTNGLSLNDVDLDGQTLAGADLADFRMGNLSLADSVNLMGYIVKCALPTGASLSATVAGQVYTWQGGLGLAPSWQGGPFSGVSEHRWVTACLLAHTNRIGRHVAISLRSDNIPFTQSEQLTYPDREGAFYGDAFITPPVLEACESTDDDPDSDEQIGRSCASGDCGIPVAGVCESLCHLTAADGYYANCPYAEAITAYHHQPPPRPGQCPYQLASCN
jgi:hypothetical protein